MLVCAPGAMLVQLLCQAVLGDSTAALTMGSLRGLLACQAASPALSEAKLEDCVLVVECCAGVGAAKWKCKLRLSCTLSVLWIDVAAPEEEEEEEPRKAEEPAAEDAAPADDADDSAADCAGGGLEVSADDDGELAAATAASSSGGLLARERWRKELIAAESLDESPNDERLALGIFQPVLRLDPLMRWEKLEESRD